MPRAKTTEKLTPAALQQAINKQFGAGTIGFANDPTLEIQRLSSGVLVLDYILNGGFARGRYAELYGDYSAGKTLVALLTIAAAQEEGLNCAFFDVEKSFDPVHAERIGVDTSKLAFPLRKKGSGEECIDIMEAHLYSGIYDLIVCDSIAALLPEAERDDSISKASMGTYQARLMSKALRKLTNANQNTVVIFINQLRDSLSMFVHEPVTSGGRAMGFYAGTRIKFQKVETLKEPREVFDPRKMKDVTKDTIIGHRVLLTIAKDKTGAQPFDEATFSYLYEEGRIDEEEEIIYLLRRLGELKAGGKPIRFWLNDKPQKKYLPKQFKKLLRENEDFREAMLDIIYGEEDATA